MTRMYVSDIADIRGHQQHTLALTTAAAQTAALEEGIYDVLSDADCFIKVWPTANDVTTSTGYFLKASNVITIRVLKDDKIGGIVASSTATFSYHRVG